MAPTPPTPSIPTWWQMRELRFDSKLDELQLTDKEHMIAKYGSVSDIKGNDGLVGYFTVTNLRLVWIKDQKPKVNITIGFQIVVSIRYCPGTQDVLVILTKYNDNKYEFKFGLPKEKAAEAARCVKGVCRVFHTTSPYRTMKLRVPELISRSEAELLPKEIIHSRFRGVNNLGPEEANMGAMLLTNVRMIWFAVANEKFNLSLPYMQMSEVKLVDSEKYGQALLVQTPEWAGAYRLGFKTAPGFTISILEDILRNLKDLWMVYAVSPVMGVEYDPAEPAPEDDLEFLNVETLGKAGSSSAPAIQDYDDVVVETEPGEHRPEHIRGHTGRGQHDDVTKELPKEVSEAKAKAAGDVSDLSSEEAA